MSKKDIKKLAHKIYELERKQNDNNILEITAKVDNLTQDCTLEDLLEIRKIIDKLKNF